MFNFIRLRLNRRMLPLALSLVVDLVITLETLAWAGSGLARIIDRFGEICWNEKPGQEKISCKQRVLQVRVLAALAMGAALAFG